jgi:hypothetical protein
MSKKEDLMDISKAEQLQNVQKRPFSQSITYNITRRRTPLLNVFLFLSIIGLMTATFAECFLIFVHHRLDDGHFC